MNTYKKLFAGTLAAVTIFSFAGGRLFSAPSVANAATDAEMQAQITALLAQIAALQASLSGSSSSCYTFTMNLTLGSTGEGVRALQVYLNNKGYVVATAGPGSKGNETTYFGGLTRAALAKFQAAMGISPAVGYFGPITRAKVNFDCTPGTGGGTGTGTTTTPPTGGTTLNGGEADINNYDLRREDSNGDEGESKVEVFTSKFDVDDGDVRIDRIEITASSTDDTLDQKPWTYFDKIYVMDGDGKTLASMNADSRDDWDEGDDNIYTISVSSLNDIVREDGNAELTVAFDIAGSIDTADQAQEFDFYVDDEGIRARDGDGIDHFTGDNTDTATFGFGAEQNGDLTVKESDDDPSSLIMVSDPDQESDEYTVFVFDIDNDDTNGDALITDVTINATTTGGPAIDDLIRTATFTLDGDEYDCDIDTNSINCNDLDTEIAGDDTISGELVVTLVTDATSTDVTFDIAGATDVEAEGVDSGDNATIDGAATSATHTVAAQGIVLEASSVDSEVHILDTTANSYGEYSIVFEVTALTDDAFISSTTDADDTGNEGVAYAISGSAAFAGTSTQLLSCSGCTTDTGFFKVPEGASRTFTLTVTLDPSTSGIFEVDLDTVTFNDAASYTGSSIFTVDSDDADFQTDPINIPS